MCHKKMGLTSPRFYDGCHLQLSYFFVIFNNPLTKKISNHIAPCKMPQRLGFRVAISNIFMTVVTSNRRKFLCF